MLQVHGHVVAFVQRQHWFWTSGHGRCFQERWHYFCTYYDSHTWRHLCTRTTHFGNFFFTFTTNKYNTKHYYISSQIVYYMDSTVLICMPVVRWGSWCRVRSLRLRGSIPSRANVENFAILSRVWVFMAPSLFLISITQVV